MAWSEWWYFTKLFDLMWDNRTRWAEARDLPELTERVTVVGGEDPAWVGEYGFSALRAALSEDYHDEDELMKRVWLAALSRPAAEYGFVDDEWQGYHVSKLFTGEQVYARDQFAEPLEWVAVAQEPDASEPGPPDAPVLELDAHQQLYYDPHQQLYYDAQNWYLRDQVTSVTQDPVYLRRFHDSAGNVYVGGELWTPGERMFDRELGRWGQVDHASGEFEYFHNEDQIWEREAADGWTRWHEAAADWLRFDHLSGTFLYRDAWRTRDQIDALTAGISVAGAVEDEMEEVASPPVEDTAWIEQLAARRDTEIRQVIAEIRDEGVGPEVLSDSEIAERFDAQVMAVIGTARH